MDITMDQPLHAHPLPRLLAKDFLQAMQACASFSHPGVRRMARRSRMAPRATICAAIASLIFTTSAKSMLDASVQCSSNTTWGHGAAYLTDAAYKNLTAPSPGACCTKCKAEQSRCNAWNHKLPSENCFLFHKTPELGSHHPKQTSVYGSTPSPAPTPVPPAPPNALNVLMIAIDDMRPELEPYGADHMHTPNIQKLADRSMLFSRAYVQVAVCMPSRNALLFGRRPDTAKAWSIAASQFPRICGGSQCSGNECGNTCGIREASGRLAVTLPGWFYQHGYYTVGACVMCG